MASKPSKRYFHLVFSITTAASMAFVMTAVNVGLPADFLQHGMKAFGTAFALAAPVYLLAPQVRRLGCRFVELS